jgi:plastocyanin
MALSLHFEAVAATNLDVTVLTVEGKPLAGAVITADPEGGPQTTPPPVKATIVQADLAFAPDLLVIPVGSSVDFPNNDTVGHQIYSFAPAKSFQLPIYRGNPYPPVRFDKPGLVTLGCNIHDAMLAYIVVTDARFYGRTDASGRWKVPDMPTGKVKVTVWHPRLREGPSGLERETQVPGTGHAELGVRLSKPLRPAPVKDRPHSWDAY